MSGALPLLTSWKTITVGTTLRPIIETTVATDVVKPLYEPSQVYRPGRVTWSWLLWQDPSMNLADQQMFIKLAADLGYEYILIDALWDETRLVDGYPGKFVVLARRAGQRWYIAATHADRERREISIVVPWLQGATMRLLHDEPDRKAGLKSVTVGVDGRLLITLEPGGGAVLFQ